MFDIGFPELLIVSIVALLVIGPEKLPETVRGVAIWVNRFKKSLANIKAEFENEIGADEIRRQVHNDTIMRELNETKQQVEGIFDDAKTAVAEAQDAARIDTDAIMKPTKPATNTGQQNETGEDDRSKQSGSGG